MAVHLRLLRMGAKKQAFYRIVASDSRRARDGRFLEIIGTYNPIRKPAEVKVFEDKVTNWLDQGAQPTDTVRSLLTQIGFIEKYTKAKRGIDVTGLSLKTTIKERSKKTRQMKKAAVAKASEAPEQTKESKEAQQSDQSPTEQ